MLEAKRLLSAVVNSLRTVIGPAVTDPYAKSQAYTAAVILEFVSRQVEDRSDLASVKRQTLTELFDELSQLPGLAEIAGHDDDQKRRLSHTIEALYAARGQISPLSFETANRRIRLALRQLLDSELLVAGAKPDR